jgi:Beta-propeller repeat
MRRPVFINVVISMFFAVSVLTGLMQAQGSDSGKFGNSSNSTVSSGPGKAVLDPVLSYSTYLGVPGDIGFLGGEVSATNSAGEVCAVVGQSPMLTKLNSSGAVIYSVTLPRLQYNAVAVDLAGNCYLAGRDLVGLLAPTPGAFQTVQKGGQFVMKYDGAGSVVYATYLGGNGPDIPRALAVDSNGDAFLTGEAGSTDFPTQNAYQQAQGGAGDAFVAVLNPTGTALIYSTYLGGVQEDSGNALAIDAGGNVYITGTTHSSNFPVLGNPAPLQSGFSGTADAFVTKLNSSGAPVYSTYLSGSGGSQGLGIAAGSSGNAYVTGNAGSSDFPLQNPVQSTWQESLFVAEINADGTALVYSTFLGSMTNAASNQPVPIAADSTGQTYVTGPLPTGGSVPTVSPIMAVPDDAFTNGFVTVISPSGASILFSSYLWGAGESITVDSPGNIYIGGAGNPAAILNASNGTYIPANCQFPTLNCITFVPSQPFALKIAPTAGPVLAAPAKVAFLPTVVLAPSETAPVRLANAASSGTIAISNIAVTGDFSESDSCSLTLNAAASCLVNLVFTPTAGGTRTGTLNISDDQPGSPHIVQLSGTGLNPQETLAPSALTFAPQDVSSTSSAQVITLTNTDSGTVLTAALSVTISDISVSGTDFHQTNNCVSSLPPGSSCGIQVTFAPAGPGERTGTLTVTDNAAGSPHAITLMGTGVAADDFAIGPTSGSATSQTVTAGESATFNLTVTPGASLSGTVNLTCSLSPVVTPAPTCNVPASVNVTPGNASPVQVLVATTAPVTTAGILDGEFFPGMPLLWLTTLLGSGLFLLRRLGGRAATALTIAVVALAMLVGCGGSGSSTSPHPLPGTPSGTYTVTVTAVSGTASHNTSSTLVVQ